MSKETQLSADSRSAASVETGPPSAGSVDQSARNTSVAAILAKGEERQIPGLDIHGDLDASLDHAAEAEEEDELAEDEAVEDEARANQP